MTDDRGSAAGYDVIVVGYGGAGATAAMAAHDVGARVLVLEKAPVGGAAGEVIGTGGTPIPGLFSAGELGSIWGSLYPGAGNVTEAVVFGRIAGRSAAAG